MILNMASATRREDDHGDEVIFIHEEDGSVTAHDLETGISRGGDTRAEALGQLAEALALENGSGEPIEDVDAYLREIGINPDERKERELPEFLQ